MCSENTADFKPDTLSTVDDICNEVLVVDDNSSNLKLVRTILIEEGYKVRLATNGMMALNSARARIPHLILLDISMPGMSGFEVCKQLKQDELLRDIPVIFLSALREQVDIVRGFEVGGVDFVTKPFEIEVLLARISTHLTISRLQYDLQEMNEDLEDRVRKRTREITDAQNELVKSETRLKHALTASNEGIWDWDIVNDRIYYNDTFFTMLSYDPEELLHVRTTWIELLHPDDKQKCQDKLDECLHGKTGEFKIEYRLKDEAGNYCWILSKAMVVERDAHGNASRLVGTHTDISAEKMTQEHLKQLASYDPLTNLPNRKYFNDLLVNAIARADRKSQRHAILFLDLDRFKNINDSLGHSAGDQLLVEVSVRLLGILRGDDSVARLGGDEFIVLLQDISGAHRAAEVAHRIVDVLNDPFDILGHQVVISPSIGIVLYPDHGNSPEDLLKNADTAMYQSKQGGGNSYWFFSDEMNVTAQRRLELEESFRRGLTQNEFIVHYQPKVSLSTGEIMGMEALARWNRNGAGLVSPAEFIPIAEETGLIVPMGQLILQTAIEKTKHWLDNNLMRQKMAINISARQFRQKDLLDNIKNALQSIHLSPEYLELEITENSVMDHTEDSIQIMKQLKDYGVSLAIDDFGTGYSSLSYLKKFPIDTLKVDMSFITDMEESEVNKSIVDAIIKLAHNLKLEVVAEGVETHEQVATLTDMGCETIQGFLFSKPLASEDMEDMLKSGKNLYQ